LCTAAVVTVSAAPALTKAVAAGIDSVATGELTWAPCGAGAGVDPRQECTTISVPVDYAAPDGAHVNLAVSRIHTLQPQRRGALFLIPGGPGNPGLNLPSSAAAKLPPEVFDLYDIVSFDPRGLGASSPVTCRPASARMASAQMMPWPAPGGDIAPNVEWAAEMATACSSAGGLLPGHISTRNEAQDIDTIRQDLGEQRMSFWGVSYGTYVGAVYATMYPDRTDRVVLDSNDDPDPTRVARGWAANYAVGVEDRFPDFATWASARDAQYHLGADPATVRSTFLALAARLDTTPLPWTGALPPELDGNALRSTMLSALNSDDNFPQLAAVMSAALLGGQLPSTSAPPAAAAQNTAAVVSATTCSDVRWPRSVDGYKLDVAANRQAYPLTAGMPVNIYACAFWPDPAVAPATVGGAGPANVLLVQNLRDPATPYSGALRMRDALGGRARMVTVDAGGHGSYLANGNACGDSTVTAFLAHGQWPGQDVRCQP
jgi:pimeloyl-ACP methyl ester carboxylesterase